MADKLHWRDLPQPPSDEIDDAIAWLETIPADVVPGYYLSGLDDMDHNAYVADDFCERHARSAAKRLRRTSPGVCIAMCIGSIDGVDGERWCSTKGCRHQLDVGHLTDYGIDSVLGVTEVDPCDVALTVHGLQNAAASLTRDDERWRLWMFHVDYMRAELAAARREG